MSSIRNGWQAERFVRRLLELGTAVDPSRIVVPLAPAFPADFLVVDRAGWRFVEVKSARMKGRALHARLTPAEEKFRQGLRGGKYVIYRVLTRPGPGGDCELLRMEE